MDNEHRILLGFIGTGFLMLIAVNNLSLPLDLHTYQLSFSSDGCQFARSIGLSTKQSNGLCVAEARFIPHKLNDGGEIYLDNDKKVTVTESLIMASSQTDMDLPYTPSQRKGIKLFWIWMCLAIGVACISLLSWRKGWKKLQ